MEAPTPSIVVTNEPPDSAELTESVTAQFVVKNFEELDATFENFTTPSEKSPKFYAHGIPFDLEVYPGGYTQGSKHVGLFLNHYGDEKRWISFLLRLVNQIDATRSKRVFGGLTNFKAVSGRGYSEFILRSKLVDGEGVLQVDDGFIDDEGTVIFEVDIQVASCDARSEPWTPALASSWSPGPSIGRDLLAAKDVVRTDVTLSVGGERFEAHRLILAMRSHVLAAVCEAAPFDEGEKPAVEIADVKADAFGALLHFIYADEMPAKWCEADDDEDAPFFGRAKEFVTLADRFGVVRLKQLAELELAGDGTLSVRNAADMLLFAESHTCPQLKEAAMELVIANTDRVMKTKGWKERLTQSAPLLAEVVGEMARCRGDRKRKRYDAGSEDESDEDGDGTSARQAKRLRIHELRRRLDARGLSTDGHRNVLEERLAAGAAK